MAGKGADSKETLGSFWSSSTATYRTLKRVAPRTPCL